MLEKRILKINCFKDLKLLELKKSEIKGIQICKVSTQIINPPMNSPNQIPLITHFNLENTELREFPKIG